MISCNVCERRCKLAENQLGVCKVRKNENGKLKLLFYGKPVAIHIDPIEKKPFFHFFPGERALSIATFGCNFKCIFCQNWDISQEFREEDFEVLLYYSPEEVVELAKERGIKIIAYTYTEPTIFMEYALDIMKLAKEEGLYNVWVSNGYFTLETFEKIKKYLDGINIDLKGDEDFYLKYCGGINREFVLRNILLSYKEGIHTEVTFLVIEGVNDSEKYLERMSDEIPKEIPLHISAYYRAYKAKWPDTSKERIEEVVSFFKKRGHLFVYPGNVFSDQNTYCPSCGNLLVSREHYVEKFLDSSECPVCKTKIYGKFS